jgi:hypothetical protein
MSYICLSHDHFTRQDLIRAIEDPGEHRQDGCAWCGQNRKTGRLFRYGSETANGHSYWDAKAFCSLACRKAYSQ